MSENSRRAVRKGLHKGAHYSKVKLVRLVGMMLIVFAKDNLAKQLKNVQGECVGTGILGKMVRRDPLQLIYSQSLKAEPLSVI